MQKVSNEDLENSTVLAIFNQEFVMYGKPDKPLFLANDVAAMIDYSMDKVGQMLDSVDDNEKLTDTIYRSGQEREMWFLTEEGLYELLMQSRKPLAKAFKKEVKSVLIQLRMGELVRRKNLVRGNKNEIFIEGATLLWRNFSGAESKFNKSGDRNFCVIIDDEKMSQKMISDGWNLKPLQKRDDDDIQKYYLQVAVRFDNFPPKVVMITRKTKITLDEESVSTLDFADIANADLILNASSWSVNGKEGIKAYLKALYVTIEEDKFAAKYAEEESPEE